MTVRQRVSEYVFSGVELQPYWEWVAAALFLLLPVDLLTTVYATQVVGLENESNPFMAWMLVQPTSVIIGIHVTALVLVAGLFHAYHVGSARSEQYGDMMLQTAKTYLVLLVIAGFLVFLNNILVIFFQVDLPSLLYQ